MSSLAWKISFTTNGCVSLELELGLMCSDVVSGTIDCKMSVSYQISVACRSTAGKRRILVGTDKRLSF